MTVLTTDQLNQLKSVLDTFSVKQLIWVSGYVYGILNSKVSLEKLEKSNFSEKSNICKYDYKSNKVTLISASQTGNARKIAQQLYDDFVKSGLNIILSNARDYNFKKISESKLLIFIISTHGEGDPPEEAVALYKYLFSKKALKMNDTSFVILSLGDRSYKYFAKAGKDLDKRLEELGAHRLYDRVDVDVDFQNDVNIWRQKILDLFQTKVDSSYHIPNQSFSSSKKNINFKNDANFAYCKDRPITAVLSSKQKITSRNSIKNIYHLEFDISGYNLCYQPGDALGVWYENDDNLIQEFLELLILNKKELVRVKNQSISLHDALKQHYELTQNTALIVEKLATISKNKILFSLIQDKKLLNSFVSHTPIIEMIRQIPVKLTAQDLLTILRPMQPRFYSISSAQLEVGEEIHITVGMVRYQINGRYRSGGASSYLIDRLKEDDKIQVFIEINNNFRLPKDPQIPIVMIGAGTGIAPFRAFIQQRALDSESSKNWLFFGNLRFIDDFLYQIEWQRYVKNNILDRIDTAWSRDQDYKIYVQDKLLENGCELWSWIQGGAYIYVCGDAKHMARDVERALIQLTSEYGNMSMDQSDDFWNTMRIQHRYQRDIY